MSDAFSEFYIPPDVASTPAPDQSFTFGATPTPPAQPDLSSYQFAFDTAPVSQPGVMAPQGQAQNFFSAPISGTDQTYTPTFQFTSAPFYGQTAQAPATAGVGAPLDFITGTSQLTPTVAAPMTPLQGGLVSLEPPVGGGAAASTPQQQQQDALSKFFNQIGGLKGLTSIAGGLMGYLANQKAQQQAADVGAQIQQAYQNAAQQTQQLAQPYITAGTPQLSMALQGALSPAQLQQYQAGQAQLAQAAARSGGVGAIQTAAAEQTMYNQALQNQQALALQLLAPGNELMSQAINQQLQGTTQGLGITLQYQTMANEAAAKLFQQLGSIGASTPQSQTNAGVP